MKNKTPLLLLSKNPIYLEENKFFFLTKKLENLKAIVIKSEIYLLFVEFICSEETNKECEKVKLQMQQVRKQIELCQNQLQYLTQK